MSSQPFKIYALFGDYGRYSGQVAKSRRFRLVYSSYLFENYFSFSDLEQGRLVADKNTLHKLVREFYENHYNAVYCGDAAEALLLQYVTKKQGLKPKCFLINDPDLFAKAKHLNCLLTSYYRETFFDEFLSSPFNHWFVTAHSRIKVYQNMGIRESNVHYIPLSLPTIEMFFPSMAACIKHYRESNAGEDVVSSGSHNRDYPLLVRAVEGLNVRVEIICNVKAHHPIPSRNVRWSDSMPEEEYIKEIASARYVVLPLKGTERVSGQLNCTIGMYMGKLIIAPKCAMLEEYLEDNQSGVLYKQGDAGSLREKIVFVEANYSKLQFVGENAREREKNLSRVADGNLERLVYNMRWTLSHN